MDYLSMKTCTKCKENKELISFYFRKDRAKYNSICRLCVENSKPKKNNIPFMHGTKTCNTCLMIKDITCFSPIKKNKDGRNAQCIKCINNGKRARRHNRKELSTFLKCPECKIEKQINIFEPIKTNNKCRACREIEKHITFTNKQNGLKKCTRCKIYKDYIHFYKNPTRNDGIDYSCIACNKLYYNRNKARVLASNNKRYHIRFKKDQKFRLLHNMRSRIHHALKVKKSQQSLKLVGCAVEELKIYLETIFYPHPFTGEIMSWDNYGILGWHVDHIIPISSFNLSDKDQSLKACHYTNLQPLWAVDNLAKGDKLNWKRE